MTDDKKSKDNVTMRVPSFLTSKLWFSLDSLEIDASLFSLNHIFRWEQLAKSRLIQTLPLFHFSQANKIFNIEKFRGKLKDFVEVR